MRGSGGGDGWLWRGEWIGMGGRGKAERNMCACVSLEYGMEGMYRKESVSVLEEGGWSAGVGVSVVRKEWREA